MAATTPRRRRPRSEREPDMLIAATDAFARHGYAGVSMDEIATECGITKPMLYRYFGSKEGLYLACLERSGDELSASVAAAAIDTVPPKERIRLGFLAFLGFVAHHEVGWRVLFDDSTTMPASLAQSVVERRAGLAELLATALDGPTPELRDARAHALISAGEALANWWLAHPGQSAEALADVFVSLCAG